MRIAALDIGGTSIKSGIWTGDLPKEVKEQNTEAKLGGAHVMEQAKRILHSYGSFDAIGISTAGQVDSVNGMIRYANENIPGYTGMKIRDIMEKEFSVPVAVENDVNAAAIGESRFGAGRDMEHFLCITYGTGVGGAVVLNRSIYRGSCFSAGEFGGILIHPEDRRKGEPFSGCYEKYASATALVARGKKLDENLDSGRKIFERIKESKVQEQVDQWIDEIVCGLISLIHIFNPSGIVLGGGVMAQRYILEQVQEKVKNQIMPSFCQLKICQAQLGNQAGLLGAASLAAEALERQQRSVLEKDF
ncbi:MAG: ROK family protein [Lachnospiraceae bacterium]|nr:ROK family protein [Lachnospiraceae bacterium]